MKIKFTCSTCSKTTTQPGALLFSPPAKHGACTKYHICRGCFREINKTYGLIDYQIHGQTKTRKTARP